MYMNHFLNYITNVDCILIVYQAMGVQSTVIILPTIGKDLGIPASRQQWIVSAYSLTFGCFLVCLSISKNSYI